MIAFIAWCLIGFALFYASFHPAALVLCGLIVVAALMTRRW